MKLPADVVLFDPEVTEVQARILTAGNHIAQIIGVEALEPYTEDQVYRQMRLQWEGPKGQIRQDLIYDHWGDSQKAATSLRITAEIIGEIAKSVGHVDKAGKPMKVSLNKMVEQLGNKPIAIGVRKIGKYHNVKFIGPNLESLPEYKAPAWDAGEDEVQKDLNDVAGALQSILGD